MFFEVLRKDAGRGANHVRSFAGFTYHYRQP